jgi:hypothetical protein
MGWQAPEPGWIEFYRTYVIMLLARRSWLEIEGPLGGWKFGEKVVGQGFKTNLMSKEEYSNGETAVFAFSWWHIAAFRPKPN